MTHWSPAFCQASGDGVGLHMTARAKPGAMRVDLDGVPVEPVSDADREGAAITARRKKERDQQRRIAAQAAE